MAKRRSQPNHWLTVASVAIIIAALLGIAYLADNTTSSSAQQLSSTRLLSTTTSKDNTLLPKSPYPACQALLDKANGTVTSDSEYKAALAELTALVKERDRWNDVLYNNRRSTDAEKRNARLKLAELAPRIREAQQKLANRKNQLFAEYDACLTKEKAKQKPWWQAIFTRKTSQPATTTAPTTRSTVR